MKTQNQGAALITALFIMVLVSIAAVAMSIRLQYAIKTTELSLNFDQLYLSSKLVSDWAQVILADNARKAINLNNDVAIDKLPLKFSFRKVRDITVSGQLQDDQAKFNLNNLRIKDNALYKNQLRALLHSVDSKLTKTKIDKITEAIESWVSNKNSVTAADIYSSHYIQAKPPYQNPFLPMISITELGLVDGISPALYTKLRPFVTALPIMTGPTKINLNTATTPVLMSLGGGIVSHSQAAAIVAYRNSHGNFKSPNEFVQFALPLHLSIPRKSYTLRSRYFLASAIITLSKQHLVVNSLVQRRMNKKKRELITTVLWQSQGTL